MLIDAHIHYWKIARGDYGWLKPENKTLYQDYLPIDSARWMQAYEVSGCIVVQAAPTEEETLFLLKLAEASPRILGIVGWIDLDGEHFPERYELMRRNKKFVGIRPMLHTIEEKDWILRPRVVEHLKLLAKEGFPVDIVIGSRDLPQIIRMLELVPELRTVLNHLGSPQVRSGKLEPWSEYIKELSEHPLTHCKLSGMITLAGGSKAELLQPYVERAVESFGPGRLLFGSDWPVCMKGGPIAEVMELFYGSQPNGLSDDQRKQIEGQNAIRFYGIKSHFI